MKRNILTAVLLSLFTISPLFENICYATESSNMALEQVSGDEVLSEEESSIEFVPVTLNYILEGVNKPLKASKTLNSPDDFWDDYTIKLSNRLLYGGVDIQDKIRNYYFSHYEINGRRIESIDAIIKTSEDECIINVVYAEEVPKGGYLRKGFRNGIALDYEYLSQQSSTKTFATTDLYDNTWILNLPSEFCTEFTEKNKNLANANDKTLYINTDVNSISDKEQTELGKRYDYVASISISTSMGYDNFENPINLVYTPENIGSEFENKEIKLLGVNLEGKIEELSTSLINNGSFEFEVIENFNKYQLLFIASSNENIGTIPTTENSTGEQASASSDNTNNCGDTIGNGSNDITTSITTDENTGKKNELSEASLVILISTCFGCGAIATYILSLILSLRSKNIEKKSESKNQKTTK